MLAPLFRQINAEAGLRKARGHLIPYRPVYTYAGAGGEGDDTAVLLDATWRDTRRTTLKDGGVSEFSFRQHLFSCQANILFKLGRPHEVS